MNFLTPTGAIRARWAVLMVLALAIALTVVGGAYTRHVQSQFECQARYNTAFQERSQALTRVASEDRQVSADAERAITRLIADAVAANGDRQKGQRAVNRYLKASAEIARRRGALDRERAAHPFPALPEKACT